MKQINLRDSAMGFYQQFRSSIFNWSVTIFVFSVFSVLLEATASENEIHVYTWPSYTSDELIDRFEKETGISVSVDTYTSNEQLAEVLRAGSPVYDVVVPSDSWVALLSEEGLLLPFDATQLKGFENIADFWLGAYFDPGHLYSIPFLWGTTSFMVNTELFDGDINTLSVVFDPPPALSGKIGMMPDSRDVIDLALRYLGLPACTEESAHLQALRVLLRKQQQYVYSYNIRGSVDRIVNGETAVQLIYNGAAMRARLKNDEVRYAYPKEGVTVWSDNLTIPSNARNVEGARLFLEFFLRPENIAVQSNAIRYGNAIKGSDAFMDPLLKDAPEVIIPPGVPISFIVPCSPEVVAGYQRIWDEIRAQFKQ